MNGKSDSLPSTKVVSEGPWHTSGIFNPDSAEPTTSVWGPTPAGMQSGRIICQNVRLADARLIAAAPDLLAALKELGDWIAGGLQASDDAMPDAECLKETERLAAKARAAVDKAEGRKRPTRSFLGSTPWGEIDDSP